jgi:hypothetical protein
VEDRAKSDPPLDAWDTVKAWHRDPTLYREIYTRAVGALAAAAVIYLVALFAGVANDGPAVVIFSILLAVGLVVLVLTVPGVIKHWRHVRPLFVVWNDDPDPVKAHARRLYNRLVLGLFTTIMGGLFFAAYLSNS